jgi:hypothetical protein
VTEYLNLYWISQIAVGVLIANAATILMRWLYRRTR